MTELLRRSSDGVTVKLKYLPIMQMVVLEASCDDASESQAVTVDPARALDAYNHPACYLPQPQLIWHRA